MIIYDSLINACRPVTLMLYIFFLIPTGHSGVVNSNLKEIYVKLILSDLNKAKESLAADEDISLLVLEINSNIIDLNKLNEKNSYDLRAINYTSFQNKKYFQCPELGQFNGWDFRIGHNWMNKFWRHASGCNERHDHGCQFWIGSFICMGAIPCYPLQFVLSPFIPHYYNGKFCKLGFPLDEETDTVKLMQYLNHVQSSLEVMYPEFFKDLSPFVEAELLSSAADSVIVEQADVQK